MKTPTKKELAAMKAVNTRELKSLIEQSNRMHWIHTHFGANYYEGEPIRIAMRKTDSEIQRLIDERKKLESYYGKTKKQLPINIHKKG